jgi:outer membrane protein assembly factor BamD
MKNATLVFFFILTAFVLGSCNDVEKIRKSTDNTYKLAKANEFYDKKKWEEANVLYEELIPVLKGSKDYEKMYYKYAYSFYNQGNYLTASYHFKNYSDIYPGSEYHDECEYMTCVCLYKMSPEPSLDQQSTQKAIDALQTFVNSHPDNKQLDDANKMIDEARSKMEAKDKISAELYYKIGRFQAASVAFENLIKRFPDSKNCDYFQLMVMKSNFAYAANSIPEKQEERYNAALVDYNDLIANYPNSTQKSEADKLKNIIFANLKNLKK